MKKKTGDYKNIHSRYTNRIWHRKICHADNEKGKKRNNGRSRTAKSGNISERLERKKITSTLVEANTIKQAEMKK